MKREPSILASISSDGITRLSVPMWQIFSRKLHPTNLMFLVRCNLSEQATDVRVSGVLTLAAPHETDASMSNSAHSKFVLIRIEAVPHVNRIRTVRQNIRSLRLMIFCLIFSFKKSE
jgi:hypothetical protein